MWNVNGNMSKNRNWSLISNEMQVHTADVSSTGAENRSGSLGRIATGDVGGSGWSLITRNMKRRDVGNAKKERGKRSTEPTKVENEGIEAGIPGERGEGGYIGYADRRKGTSWWNNRSLARAIASARHCARVAQQPGRFNGNGWMLASANDTRERPLAPTLFLLPRGPRRKAKSSF